jgi:O-antigen ligase
MQTKLSRFCDKLIEAGWLGAIIIIPLYFNIYTQRVFAIGKAHLLRSIALLMATAWVISAAEELKVKSQRDKAIGPIQQAISFLKQPLILPVLTFAAVYLIASLTSVWPLASFRGSYRRAQGVYTTFAYLVLFLSIVRRLRTQRQVERLITVTILTSFPVSLYAFIQHYGLDPIPWSEDVSGRVTSTLGNAISISAYLIMIVPLSIRQLVDSLSELRDKKKRALSLFSAGLYFLILVTQLIAILFSQSRGPFLGLIGGLFFLFLLWTIERNRRAVGLATVSLTVVLGLLLIVINLPNTPLTAIEKVPYIGRLSTIGETLSSGERTFMWEGAIDMVQDNPSRALIGHGPETIFVAYQPYTLPELAEVQGTFMNPDRAHNDMLDSLLTTGILGMIAYLLLFGAIFYYSLKWLGLIMTTRERKAFIALLVASGLVGAGSLWYLTGSPKLIGISVPGGMLTGLTGYLILYIIRHRGDDTVHKTTPLLLIALFSALAAHFIEIQSGIPVTPTRVTFWVHAALIVVIGLSLQGARPLDPLEAEAASNKSDKGKQSRRSRRRKANQGLRIDDLILTHVLTQSLLVSLILTITGFSLINLGINALLVEFMALIWLFAGLLVILEAVGRDGTEWSAALGSFLTGSLIPCLIFIPLHAANRPGSGDPARIITVHYLCIGLFLLTIAAGLFRRASLPRRFWHQSNWWLYLGSVVIVVVLIVTTNLNRARADIYFKVGDAMLGYENWDTGITFFKRAVKLAPRQDYYHRWLGQAYLRQAMADAEHRSVWLGEAQGALERAKELNPLNSESYAHLGELYQYWGTTMDNAEERAEKLEKALGNYQRAMDRNPATEGQRLKERIMNLRIDLAEAYASTGRVDAAIAEAEAAKKLAPAEKQTELDEMITTLESQR